MRGQTAQPTAQPSASTAKHPRCSGTRLDGLPCQAQALPGGVFCFVHAPDLADKRDQARRQGGQAHSNAARLRGLVPPRLLGVYDKLEAALEEVHDGTLDPKQATAMASLGRALVAVLTAGEMEERLRKLEERT